MEKDYFDRNAADEIIKEIVARDIKRMLEIKRLSEEKKASSEQARGEYSGKTL